MTHPIPHYPDDIVRVDHVGDVRRHRIEGATELWHRTLDAEMQEFVDYAFNGKRPERHIIIPGGVRP